jgi:hypothetical protein
MAQTLLQRNTGILQRMKNLAPLAPKLESLFTAGKREQLKDGRDSRGNSFMPLARSTMEQPRQSSTPFLKHGDSSTILTRYEVSVRFHTGEVTVSAGWPMTWIHYHVVGGPHLPRRDPTGFRDEDKKRALAMVRDYVMGRI